MNNTERKDAEDFVRNIGSYIEIKDYGLLLAATHLQIEKRRINNERILASRLCACTNFPKVKLVDKVFVCCECNKPISTKKGEAYMLP